MEQAKRKEDLRKYVLDEYSGLLGKGGIDKDMSNNKFYKNHLRALELKREEERAEQEAGKLLIMQFADQMQYDDDFDEEELFSGRYVGKKRPEVSGEPSKKAI